MEIYLERKRGVVFAMLCWFLAFAFLAPASTHSSMTHSWSWGSPRFCKRRKNTRIFCLAYFQVGPWFGRGSITPFYDELDDDCTCTALHLDAYQRCSAPHFRKSFGVTFSSLPKLWWRNKGEKCPISLESFTCGGSLLRLYVCVCVLYTQLCICVGWVEDVKVERREDGGTLCTRLWGGSTSKWDESFGGASVCVCML